MSQVDQSVLALRVWELLREMVNRPEVLDPDGSVAMNALMQSSGVSGGALRVLRLIPFDGHIAMRELVTELGHDKSRTTVTVNSLERHGYVTRVTDPDDRRSRLVSLTPLALPLAREVRLLYTQPPVALSKLSLNELNDFLVLLRRIEVLSAAPTSLTGAPATWPKAEGARYKSFPLG